MNSKGISLLIIQINNLKWHVLIPVHKPTSQTQVTKQSTIESTEELFIPVENIRFAVDKNQTIFYNNFLALLTPHDINEKYSVWLLKTLSSYDILISLITILE